jgi:hypothetical protein
MMRQRRRLFGLGLAVTLALGGLAGPTEDVVQAQEVGSGQLSGQVLGPDGAPLADAIVTVSSAELEAGDTTLTTDGNGQFTLGPVRPGLYDVAVELNGYRRGLLATLRVDDGRTTRAEIVLERRANGEDGY